MTDFELAVEYMHRSLTKYAEVYQYNWNPDFCKGEIKRSVSDLEKCDGYKKIDITKLTKEEMLTLGFKYFDEKLLCVPLWLMPHVKEGVVVNDISGGQFEFKSSEQDNDHRFGCLAFGIVVD